MTTVSWCYFNKEGKIFFTRIFITGIATQTSVNFDGCLLVIITKITDVPQQNTAQKRVNNK